MRSRGCVEGQGIPTDDLPGVDSPARLAAKAACAPFGRAVASLEKNWFEYWMDVVGNYAVVPYETVRRDSRSTGTFPGMSRHICGVLDWDMTAYP